MCFLYAHTHTQTHAYTLTQAGKVQYHQRSTVLLAVFLKSVYCLIAIIIKVNRLKCWHRAKVTSVVRWSTELTELTDLTVKCPTMGKSHHYFLSEILKGLFLCCTFFLLINCHFVRGSYKKYDENYCSSQQTGWVNNAGQYLSTGRKGDQLFLLYHKFRL